MFNQKGLKVFHQNIRGLFHNIAKLSTFLHTHKNTHIFSFSETHIDNSTPTQLFEIPGYTFINKNRNNSTHITINDVYALSFSDHDLTGFNHKQNRLKTAPKVIFVTITIDMTIAS